MNIEDIKAKCPELVDVHWEKANGSHDHRVTMRLPYPLVEYSKAKSTQDISFSLAKVPVDKIAQVLFYGDTWRYAANEFAGFDCHYSTLDRHMAQSAANVLDGGGSGRHNTSIYLVTWGPQTAYLAGHEGDSICCGLVIQDWRFIVRICNIDLDCGEPDLIAIMTRALLRLPTVARPIGEIVGIHAPVRIAFYMAPRTAELYTRQATRASDQGEPNPLLYFRGLPIRETGALRHDEPRVL